MVWKILSGMFHVGNIGTQLVAEQMTKQKSKRLMEIREAQYQSWLDPELEAKTRAYVSDPRNHDEVWDKLEQYKYDHRYDIEARFKAQNRFNIWDHFVDGTRKRITPNSGAENLATACFMDMQGKKPKYMADAHRYEPLW